MADGVTTHDLLAGAKAFMADGGDAGWVLRGETALLGSHLRATEVVELVNGLS